MPEKYKFKGNKKITPRESPKIRETPTPSIMYDEQIKEERTTDSNKKAKLLPLSQSTSRQQKKYTKDELRKILMERVSFHEIDKIVNKRETGNAEALFVKFNPRGERQDYNLRNKNRYILVSKATKDIHLELILEVLKEEKLIK